MSLFPDGVQLAAMAEGGFAGILLIVFVAVGGSERTKNRITLTVDVKSVKPSDTGVQQNMAVYMLEVGFKATVGSASTHCPDASLLEHPGTGCGCPEDNSLVPWPGILLC